MMREAALIVELGVDRGVAGIWCADSDNM